jgi:hypothetical protein
LAAKLWKLIVQHENRISDFERSVHHLVPRTWGDTKDLGAKGLLVKLDGALGIANG